MKNIYLSRFLKTKQVYLLISVWAIILTIASCVDNDPLNKPGPSNDNPTNNPTNNISEKKIDDFLSYFNGEYLSADDTDSKKAKSLQSWLNNFDLSSTNEWDGTGGLNTRDFDANPYTEDDYAKFEACINKITSQLSIMNELTVFADDNGASDNLYAAKAYFHDDKQSDSQYATKVKPEDFIKAYLDYLGSYYTSMNSKAKIFIEQTIGNDPKAMAVSKLEKLKELKEYMESVKEEITNNTNKVSGKFKNIIPPEKFKELVEEYPTGSATDGEKEKMHDANLNIGKYIIENKIKMFYAKAPTSVTITHLTPSDQINKITENSPFYALTTILEASIANNTGDKLKYKGSDEVDEKKAEEVLKVIGGVYRELTKSYLKMSPDASQKAINFGLNSFLAKMIHTVVTAGGKYESDASKNLVIGMIMDTSSKTYSDANTTGTTNQYSLNLESKELKHNSAQTTALKNTGVIMTIV